MNLGLALSTLLAAFAAAAPQASLDVPALPHRVEAALPGPAAAGSSADPSPDAALPGPLASAPVVLSAETAAAEAPASPAAAIGGASAAFDGAAPAPAVAGAAPAVPMAALAAAAPAAIPPGRGLRATVYPGHSLGEFTASGRSGLGMAIMALCVIFFFGAAAVASSQGGVNGLFAIAAMILFWVGMGLHDSGKRVNMERALHPKNAAVLAQDVAETGRPGDIAKLADPAFYHRGAALNALRMTTHLPDDGPLVWLLADLTVAETNLGNMGLAVQEIGRIGGVQALAALAELERVLPAAVWKDGLALARTNAGAAAKQQAQSVQTLAGATADPAQAEKGGAVLARAAGTILALRAAGGFAHERRAEALERARDALETARRGADRDAAATAQVELEALLDGAN